MIFKTVKKVLIIFAALTYLNAGAQVFFNDLENVSDTTIKWSGTEFLDSLNSFSGKYSAYCDSLHIYGLGIATEFPEDLKGKSILLVSQGKVKSQITNPNAIYVITLKDKNREVFWHGIKLDKVITGTNKWFSFTDTLKIPSNYTRNTILKTYLWNPGKKKINLDDLEFSMSPLKLPSFLDNLNKTVKALPDTVNFIFENNFYKLGLSPEPVIIITDTSGLPFLAIQKVIIDTGKYLIKQNFKSYKVKNSENGSLINLKFKNDTVNTEVKIKCNVNSPEIEFTVECKFKKRIRLHRLAFTGKYFKPLISVNKYNRKIDTSNFENEYWLGTEGLVCGDSAGSLAIYHNTDLSSTQLDVKDSLLILNLDYENDHNFLRFPLLPDTFNFKKDLSKSIFLKKYSFKRSFRIFAGVKNKILPSFMKNPGGFLATYIWTEHADWTDIRTHRATYFGTENITDTAGATGGFVKYGIPVTKSVFYTNPDSINNNDASGGLFKSKELSIKKSTDFLDFLGQIAAKGSEICLHTPDHYTTNPEILNDALKFMKKRFGSKSWIDHGYNNLPVNNREDIVCDGAFTDYVKKAWEKYDLKYFWNPYMEDFRNFSGWEFDNSIEKIYTGFGNSFPRPDFFKHETITGDLYLWITPAVTYIDKNMWGFYFSNKRLADFVNNWSVEINHCYPAWTSPSKGFWEYGKDSVIVAQHGFNETLKKMSDLKKEKLLNVTTVGEFMDYGIKINNISYTVLPDGRIKITNINNEPVKDLAFSVKAKHVTVNGLKPSMKRSGKHIVFWFDIDNGESKIIRIIE